MCNGLWVLTPPPNLVEVLSLSFASYDLERRFEGWEGGREGGWETLEGAFIVVPLTQFIAVR